MTGGSGGRRARGHGGRRVVLPLTADALACAYEREISESERYEAKTNR